MCLSRMLHCHGCQSVEAETLLFAALVGVCQDPIVFVNAPSALELAYWRGSFKGKSRRNSLGINNSVADTFSETQTIVNYCHGK